MIHPIIPFGMSHCLDRSLCVTGHYVGMSLKYAIKGRSVFFVMTHTKHPKAAGQTCFNNTARLTL